MVDGGALDVGAVVTVGEVVDWKGLDGDAVISDAKTDDGAEGKGDAFEAELAKGGGEEGCGSDVRGDAEAALAGEGEKTLEGDPGMVAPCVESSMPRPGGGTPEPVKIEDVLGDGTERGSLFRFRLSGAGDEGCTGVWVADDDDAVWEVGGGPTDGKEVCVAVAV